MPLRIPLLQCRCCPEPRVRKWKRHRNTLARAEKEDSPDLVTKIFGGLFGKNALEDRKPFGMQRMEEEDMYELYPATTDIFADPVENDDKEMASFRPLLARTRLEKIALRYFNLHAYNS